MIHVQELIDDQNRWAKETFGYGQRNPAILHHLKKEVDELIEEIQKKENDPKIREEFADCFLLLFDSAVEYGLDMEHIKYEMKRKIEINKNRQWGSPDENGVVEHKKNNESQTSQK